MAIVQPTDIAPGEKMARRCGVAAHASGFRESRPRWFEQVTRQISNSVLGKVMDLEVSGWRPHYRPNQTLNKTVRRTYKI